MSGANLRPWKKLKRLGSGAFGTVYLTNNSVAVKTASWSNCSSLKKESRFLWDLRGNPFVVECFGEDKSQEGGGEWFYNVLMVYARGGTLDDIIRGYGRQIMPERVVGYYSYLLLRGMSEIHRKGVIHCDIKPSNILVFKNRHGLDHLKLADFGLAKFEWESDTDQARGTLKYAAPESVGHGGYSKASDVWSFGMTVLKMMFGRRSVWGRGTDRSDLMDLIVMRGAPEAPDHVSKEGKEFLKKCLQLEPERRWGPERLLRHPFIRENNKGMMVSPPGFESTDVVAMKNPFSSWNNTRGLFSANRAVFSEAPAAFGHQELVQSCIGR